MDLATFEKWQANGVHVITVSGALDFSAAVQLRLVLYGCADARADRVVIDLAGVRLVDASSINVLLAVHERLHRRGASLVVTGARDLVLQALEITGAAKTLGVYDDPEPADAPGPGAGGSEQLDVEGRWGNEINDLVGRMHGAASPAERARLRDRVIHECLPFAERLAHRFYRLGEPAEDLNQVAAVALVRSLDRFDPGNGTDFAAYATPTIVGSLRRHFRDHGWMVRPPRAMQELRLEINHATNELALQLNRAPLVADIAAHLRAEDGRVIEAMTAAQGYRPASLDAPVGVGPDAATLQEQLGADDPGFDAVVHHESLRRIVATLPERDRAIIGMRFFDNLCQREIADRIGVSQMHVSRLLARILDRIRQELLA